MPAFKWRVLVRAISSVFGMLWNYLEGVKILWSVRSSLLHLRPATIKLLAPLNQTSSDRESGEHYSSDLALRSSHQNTTERSQGEGLVLRQQDFIGGRFCSKLWSLYEESQNPLDSQYHNHES